MEMADRLLSSEDFGESQRAAKMMLILLMMLMGENLLASEQFGESQSAAKMRLMLGSRKRPMANILVEAKHQLVATFTFYLTQL